MIKSIHTSSTEVPLTVLQALPAQAPTSRPTIFAPLYSLSRANPPLVKYHLHLRVLSPLGTQLRAQALCHLFSMSRISACSFLACLRTHLASRVLLYCYSCLTSLCYVANYRTLHPTRYVTGAILPDTPSVHKLMHHQSILLYR